jgi:predicted DNA-binding transcriptional regulator YafY
MGRRSATETVGRVLHVLLRERRVQQSALAKEVEIDGDTARRILGELREAGVPVEREQEGRAVVWSVAEGWFPNGVVFEGEHASTLLRLLLRLRPSRERDALIDRITHAAPSMREVRAAQQAIMSPSGNGEADDWLSELERSVMGRYAVRVLYRAAKEERPEWRVCSVQRVVTDRPAFAMVWSHKSQGLRCYRPERIQRVLRAEDHCYVERPRDEVDEAIAESVNGFRGGEKSELSFIVRAQDWGWVEINMPAKPVRTERTATGVRVVMVNRGGDVLVRWLTGMADRVTIETDSVRAAVRENAKRALEATLLFDTPNTRSIAGYRSKRAPRSSRT